MWLQPCLMLVRGNIIIVVNNLTTQIACKNCAPFTKCSTKVDGTTIEDPEDLDLFIPM